MKRLAGKRILLVGGAGFIGHHLALKLRSFGADVFIIDSLQVNNIRVFEKNHDSIPNADLYLRILRQRLDSLKYAGVPLIEQDARDYDQMWQQVAAVDPDTVIQLAAVANANTSNKDPYSTFDHNLRTLENMLDISRSPSTRIQHFIYFSSSMVYGDFPANKEVTEETPCNPIGIYGALKYAGEKLVIAYNQVFNLSYTIIRPSALYGERCVSRRIGQVFIENALQGLDITINGDGQDLLDFTYVGDLVDGVAAIIKNPASRNQIFNMTYGKSRSTSELSEILARHFPEIKIKYIPKDKLTPARGTLCIDRARMLLGYSPNCPLEVGIQRYVTWYQTIWNEHKESAAKPSV